MEATLLSLAHGFSVALQPDNLWYAFLGCLVGTLVGVLPGIGPLSGISILLPVTFGLNATQAVIMLAGIYYGSQYGGSTTSILMRIPGEASSVMTCIDGNAMAREGRAGAALCIAAVGSFIAGTFGIIMLTAGRAAARDHRAALRPAGIHRAAGARPDLPRLHVVDLAGAHAADGLPRPVLGMIGIDNMTGHFRYSFDLAELGDGIGIVPVAVGLFGLGEILSTPSKNVDRRSHRAEVARAAADAAGMARGRRGRSRAAACSASSSASFRAPRTSSRASSPMRWRSASRSTRRNSARARWPASPGRNRPTTPPRPAPSCRCWRSAFRPARSPRC